MNYVPLATLILIFLAILIPLCVLKRRERIEYENFVAAMNEIADANYFKDAT